MTIDIHNDVRAFHQKFAPTTIGGPTPTLPSAKLLKLRRDLIEEEVVEELFRAIDAGDLEGIADAAADSIYVIVGLLIACGIDIRPVWQEVQRSNMAKEGGARRADGKVLKPAGWVPPNIKGVLAKQGLRPGVAPSKPAVLQSELAAPATAPAPAPAPVPEPPAPPAFTPESLAAFDKNPEAGFTVTDAPEVVETATEAPPVATATAAPEKPKRKAASKTVKPEE